jgi:hypothetical protein
MLKLRQQIVEYSQMSLGSESRVVLSRRAHKLGLHNNLLLSAGQQATMNLVAEAFEAVIGAIYVDSGNNMETVKKAVTNIKLDNHEFLKANTNPQQRLDEKRLAMMQHAVNVASHAANVKNRQQKAVVAPAGQKANESAEMVNKHALDQTEEPVQEDDTSTERQIKNGIPETVQSQTRDKSNIPLTHADASQDSAERLFQWQSTEEGRVLKYRRAEVPSIQERPRRRQQNNLGAALSQDSDHTLDSKIQRRAAAAANKLSNEGYLLGDVLGRDGTTTASEQGSSPESRVQNQDKTNAQLKSDSQDTKTMPPVRAAASKSQDQPPQSNVVSTAPIEKYVLDAKMKFPEYAEKYEAFRKRDVFVMKRAWWAASLEIASKKGGETYDNGDFSKAYVHTLKTMIASDGGKTYKGRDPEKVARRLVRLTKRARDKFYGSERSKLKTSPAGKEHKETEEIKRPGDSNIPTKPRPEKIRAPVGLTPVSPTTTVTKADALPEKGDSTLGKSNFTPEIAVPTLMATQKETSSALESDAVDRAAATSTPTVPVPVPDQQFSIPPKKTGKGKKTPATSVIKDKPNQELSGPSEETEAADAPPTEVNEDEKIQTHSKDLETLEKEILDSHKDAWQAAGTTGIQTRDNEILDSHKNTWRTAGTTDIETLENAMLNSHKNIWQMAETAETLPSWQRSKRTARARRPLKLSMNDAWKLTTRTSPNKKPVVDFNFFESETDRLVANLTQDDSGAVDAPQSQSASQKESETEPQDSSMEQEGLVASNSKRPRSVGPRTKRLRSRSHR